MNPDEAMARNIDRVLRDGPGLRTDYAQAIQCKWKVGETWMVLRCGLGGLGIGRMWCAATERDDLSEIREANERDDSDCLADEDSFAWVRSYARLPRMRFTGGVDLGDDAGDPRGVGGEQEGDETVGFVVGQVDRGTHPPPSAHADAR